MKRIECENEDCTQTLGADDVQCAQCGRQQTTRGWLLVLALVYYPVLTALLALGAVTVVGLAFTGTPPTAALAVAVLAAVAVYGRMTAGAVGRYRRRRRRIEDAADVESFGGTADAGDRAAGAEGASEEDAARTVGGGDASGEDPARTAGAESRE